MDPRQQDQHNPHRIEDDFFETHQGDSSFFSSPFMSSSTQNIPGASNIFMTTNTFTSSSYGQPGTGQNFRSHRGGSGPNFRSHGGPNIKKGSSNINISDGVKMHADGNIVLGAANIQKTKKSKSRPTSKSPHRKFPHSSHSQNIQHSQRRNYENSEREDSGDDASTSNIKIGDNVTLSAGKSVIIGAKYVTINDDIDDEDVKKRFYELMGGKEKFEKGFKLFCESETDYESSENPIRKEPTSVLKVCTSICMILWDFNDDEGYNAIGTGFLVKDIPGFDGVVLLTAGHNFKPDDDVRDHTFFFKAMDGNEKRKDVVRLTWQEILTTRFSMVTSRKGNQILLKGLGDDDEDNILCQQNKTSNVDLDYCAIFLPECEKFFKDQGLDMLEVKNTDFAQNEKVFYVGHPHIGFFPGTYKRSNDSAYASLHMLDDKKYSWTNESGESWFLYRTGDLERLEVDKACPYYNTGYTHATFVNGGLLGPDGEKYKFIEGDEEEKDSKALRFSYGTKKKSEEDDKRPDVIKYTLDTKGGASGSPVLGSEYTVKAIHTFGSQKQKISGGTKIDAVLKNLNELKSKFPEYFSNEYIQDFVQHKRCDIKLENGRKCACEDPLIVKEGQNGLEGLRQAKEAGVCVQLHLSPEDLNKLQIL